MYTEQRIHHTKGAFQTQYRSREPLTDQQIAHYAPSVMQLDKHESRSERYTQIPTIDVVNGLRREGFMPYEVMQSRTRIEGKREFAKHLIKFRHQSDVAKDKPDLSEIVVVNAHDGGASYRMLGGQFRVICSNGLIAFCGVDEAKVAHRGNVIDNVIEGAFRVLDDLKLVEEHRDGMKAITLSKPEQTIFAEQALALRYETVEQSPITVEQALQAQRFDDRANDLWTTFNRVQENVVRGGQRFYRENGHRARTRGVTGIDQNVKLNQALWALAEKMAQLKTAAV